MKLAHPFHKEEDIYDTEYISPAGRQAIVTQIHHAINQMQVAIDFGKKLFSRPKRDQNGKLMLDKEGNPVFETIWRGPDYLLDEHDYDPGGWKAVTDDDCKKFALSNKKP